MQRTCPAVKRVEETPQGRLAVLEVRLGKEVFRDVQRLAEDIGWLVTELMPCLVAEGLPRMKQRGACQSGCMFDEWHRQEPGKVPTRNLVEGLSGALGAARQLSTQINTRRVGEGYAELEIDQDAVMVAQQALAPEERRGRTFEEELSACAEAAEQLTHLVRALHEGVADPALDEGN